MRPIALQFAPTVRKMCTRLPSTNISRLCSMELKGYGSNSIQRYRAVADNIRHFSTDAGSPGDVHDGVDYYSLDPLDGGISFGDFNLIASQSETGRQFVDMEKFSGTDGPKIGDIVWIRGRVSGVRAKGNAVFIVLRSGSFHTIQACHFKDKADPEESKKLMKYTSALPLESIVDIMGVVTEADVKSCSVTNRELHIKKVDDEHCINLFWDSLMTLETIVVGICR